MARYTIDGRRYDTDKMTSLGISTNEQGGVKITDVFITKRTKRVFVERYSIWDRGEGAVVGATLEEADREDIGWLADRFNCDELFALLPDDSE